MESIRSVDSNVRYAAWLNSCKVGTLQTAGFRRMGLFFNHLRKVRASGPMTQNDELTSCANDLHANYDGAHTRWSFYSYIGV